MMRNHMVVQQIVSTGIRIAAASIRGAKIFSKYESKVYTNLYGRAPGRGVRHGLAAGGIVGSFINNDNQLDDNGQIQKVNGPKASKPDKTRGGFRPVNGGKYSAKYRRYNRKRCTCFGKSRRSSYR